MPKGVEPSKGVESPERGEHHPIQIFKAGTHTAMSGVTLAFSEADLTAMVDAYDQSLHEAPIVVGHPKHDAPAYGWVKSLARVGDVLLANPTQVDPAFAEMVGAGRFKKVSASFYAPGAPNNPVPETYYLRHVGFLGARPPAVKGLRDAQFADTEEGVLTLEFGDWADTVNAGMWRRLRDFFIDQFGLEKADVVIPDYSVQTLEAEANKPEPDRAEAAPFPAYSEVEMPGTETHGPTPAELAARESALAAQETALNAREQALKDAETQARRKSISDFAERLEAEGRLLPRHRAGLVEFMAAQTDDAVLEFGEGEAAFKGASLEWLKGFLADLPVQVDYAERARGGATEPPARFAAPEHHQVDQGRMALHTKALAYQEAHPGTSYADAVLTISNGA